MQTGMWSSFMMTRHVTAHMLLVCAFDAKEQSKMKEYGYDVRNDRKEILLNFAQLHHLRLHYFSSKGETREMDLEKHQLGVQQRYRLLTRRQHTTPPDNPVLNTFDIGSDHRLVRCSTKYDIRKEKKKFAKTNKYRNSSTSS